MPDNPFVLAAVGLGMITALTFILMLATRYRRCPSNRILVIYGKISGGQSARCLQGGGAFVWPLIQSYEYLNLDPMQIDIPLKGALSSENIRVSVPSVFTVAIGTQPEIMQNAAIRLLGMKAIDITHQARDLIFGQLRQVIASMPIDAINRDRDKFLHNIQSSLEPELNKIGLVLINVNITDITDESGYIEALGRKAASEAIQKAEVDVAQQNKLGSIGVAAAERERSVQVAETVKDQEIGTKSAEREKAVRLAELDKERTVGERTANFEQEVKVREAEQNMRIRVAAANAMAIAGENDSKIKVAATNAALAVKEAEAFALSETKRREADAAVAQAQHLAEALAAEAFAKRVEAEQRAAVEAPARAAKARITVEAEAAAERARIEAGGRAEAMAREAEGEAKVIFARLEAEARGQYEILARKAEGLRLLVESCGGAEQAFQLLMLEHVDQLAKTAAGAISNIKFDKITVWDNGSGSGGASGFLRSLGSAVPPLFDVMKNIGGVQLPDFLGKAISNSPEQPVTQAAAPNVPPPATPVPPKPNA